MKKDAWRTESTRRLSESEKIEQRLKKRVSTIIIAIIGFLISLTFAIIISNLFTASANILTCDSQEDSSIQQYEMVNNNCYAKTQKETTTTTTSTTTLTTTTTTDTSTTTTTSITTAQTTTTYAPKQVTNSKWNGQVLTSQNGRIQGPSGQETYYNLPMEGIVSRMRRMGFDEENYPYWVRDDGVKMLGPYVMCAANLELRPRGSTVESSLGTALVCDTGGFAKKNPKQLDIAVAW